MSVSPDGLIFPTAISDTLPKFDPNNGVGNPWLNKLPVTVVCTYLAIQLIVPAPVFADEPVSDIPRRGHWNHLQPRKTRDTLNPQYKITKNIEDGDYNVDALVEMISIGNIEFNTYGGGRLYGKELYRVNSAKDPELRKYIEKIDANLPISYEEALRINQLLMNEEIPLVFAPYYHSPIEMALVLQEEEIKSTDLDKGIKYILQEYPDIKGYTLFRYGLMDEYIDYINTTYYEPGMRKFLDELRGVIGEDEVYVDIWDGRLFDFKDLVKITYSGGNGGGSLIYKRLGTVDVGTSLALPINELTIYILTITLHEGFGHPIQAASIYEPFKKSFKITTQLGIDPYSDVNFALMHTLMDIFQQKALNDMLGKQAPVVVVDNRAITIFYILVEHYGSNEKALNAMLRGGLLGDDEVLTIILNGLENRNVDINYFLNYSMRSATNNELFVMRLK